MSDALPDRPGARAVPGGKFVIVVSRYNAEFTLAMAEHAEMELRAIDPSAEIIRTEVPGSFEIPLAVQLAAKQPGTSAIIALGVIFQGATAHAQLIAASITDALMRITLESGVPVLHEVLLLAGPDQARERCLGDRLNRGIEAARAAVRMADAIAPLTAPNPSTH